MRIIVMITTLLFLTMFMISCSSEPRATDDKSQKRQRKERMSPGEVVNRYVDTITTARGKALDSADAVEERTRAIERALEEAEN
jgi:PBP1b-binding outer membrane lipoprotein LpoB